jgi:hypothetical protein
MEDNVRKPLLIGIAIFASFWAGVFAGSWARSLDVQARENQAVERGHAEWVAPNATFKWKEE